MRLIFKLNLICHILIRFTELLRRLMILSFVFVLLKRINIHPLLISQPRCIDKWIMVICLGLINEWSQRYLFILLMAYRESTCHLSAVDVCRMVMLVFWSFAVFGWIHAVVMHLSLSGFLINRLFSQELFLLFTFWA
jgi:hypothetical protein